MPVTFLSNVIQPMGLDGLSRNPQATLRFQGTADKPDSFASDTQTPVRVRPLLRKSIWIPYPPRLALAGAGASIFTIKSQAEYDHYQAGLKTFTDYFRKKPAFPVIDFNAHGALVIRQDPEALLRRYRVDQVTFDPKTQRLELQTHQRMNPKWHLWEPQGQLETLWVLPKQMLTNPPQETFQVTASAWRERLERLNKRVVSGLNALLRAILGSKRRGDF